MTGARPQRSIAWAWFAVPALIFLMVAYLTPLALLLVRSVTDPELGIENYQRILTGSGYLWTIVRTLTVAGAASLLALVLGYPIAMLIATSESKALRRFLTFCVTAPYLTSILIRTFAWQVLLGRVGLVNTILQWLGLGRQELMFNSFAVMVSLTHFLLPMMVLSLVSVMRQIDTSLLRAGRSLGGGPCTVFARVFVPASLPGVEVGMVLCFVYGVGAFVIPALLGGNRGLMLGALIRTAIDQQADYGLAAAASVLLAVAVGAVVVVFQRLMSGKVEALVSPVGGGGGPVQAGHVSKAILLPLAMLAAAVDRTALIRFRAALPLYGVAMGLLILLPQFVAVPVSFSSTRTLIVPPPGWSVQWYAEFFQPEWLRPTLTSLGIGMAVALLAGALGTLAAAGVVRGMRGRMAATMNLVLLLPLLFPTVVAAAAFYVCFIGLGLTDSVTGIVVAHVTITVPFVFALVAANLRATNIRFERAAASLGAGTLTQLRRVLLPIASGAVLTGMFFAFLTSFDESAIAVFLSGLHVRTLPRRMFEALALESDPTVGVVSVLTMTLAAVVLLGLTILQRQLARRRSGVAPDVPARRMAVAVRVADP